MSHSIVLDHHQQTSTTTVTVDDGEPRTLPEPYGVEGVWMTAAFYDAPGWDVTVLVDGQAAA